MIKAGRAANLATSGASTALHKAGIEVITIEGFGLGRGLRQR